MMNDGFESPYNYNNNGGSTITPNKNQNGLRYRPTTNNNNNTQLSQHAQNSSPTNSSKTLKRKVVQNLDLFPKMERDIIAPTTKDSSRMTSIGLMIVCLITVVEWWSWSSGNLRTVEHVVVDKSLGQKMRVDLNITFPSLHCDDLHLDLMDVAGDTQLNVEDTITKRRLHIHDGTYLDRNEIQLSLNKAQQLETQKLEAAQKSRQKDYCGPCYGAHDKENDCCNTCDEVLRRYKARQWSYHTVRGIAEQCIQEQKNEPKRMSKGEGCEVSGHMIFNRVNGNFHIVMGEGVERNGQHIHTFMPDDTPNFNSSHIINELRFGPTYEYTKGKSSSRKLADFETHSLDGVRKIVKEEDGTTGLFQYFINIVPTTYKGKKLVKSLVQSNKNTNKMDSNLNKNVDQLETNRYFATERFQPLMEDDDDDEYKLENLFDSQVNKAKSSNSKENNDYYYGDGGGEDDDEGIKLLKEKISQTKVGGSAGSSHHIHEHHRKMKSVLPGVFFIYQIYPFAIEITQESVPFLHLVIRIMATIGGVFTILGWVDAFLYQKSRQRR